MPRKYSSPGAYLIHKRVGMLSAVGVLKKAPSGGTRILCACDCGGSIIVGVDSFRHDRPHHCGCSYNPNLRDKTGTRFGYLVALRPVGESKWGEVLWECLCDCGKTLNCVAGRLSQGQVTHCGCKTKENFLLACAASRTHGMSETRIYREWAAMLDRCSTTVKSPRRYHGNLGVRVCSEWKRDFTLFSRWALANGYGDDLTLDRYPDPYGDYEPSNCRWATRSQQQRNRRNTKILEWRGQSKSIPDWADYLGVRGPLIHNRLRCGWTVERALSTPAQIRSVT